MQNCLNLKFFLQKKRKKKLLINYYFSSFSQNINRKLYVHLFKKEINQKYLLNILVQFALPHSLILRPKPKSISNKMHTSEKNYIFLTQVHYKKFGLYTSACKRYCTIKNKVKHNVFFFFSCRKETIFTMFIHIFIYMHIKNYNARFKVA